MDENSIEPVYRSEGISGFIKSLLDSYALVVGDFEPIQTVFVDNTDYEWLFWTIFFFGTVISMLLLLNIVIGVMSMSLTEVVE